MSLNAWPQVRAMMRQSRALAKGTITDRPDRCAALTSTR
jgi:hypothetical protein